jgi:tetrahydromethanopterin S-methyltransferase subunit G
MAEPPNLDPLAMWRDMLGQWERGVNSVASQAMGSDEFSRAMHQMTAVGLRLQQTVGEVVEKSLAALNLPTRNDMIAINERLGRIEARLDAMAATAPAPKAAAPRPPRTRRPPGA